MFYYDLRTDKLLLNRGTEPIARLDMESPAFEDLVVAFFRGTDTIHLPSTAEIRFGLKSKAGVLLALTDDWTKDVQTGKYSATLSTNTAEMATALGSNPYIDVYAQMVFRTSPSSDPQTSQVIEVRVFKSQITFDDGTPTALPDAAAWLKGLFTTLPEAEFIDGEDQFIVGDASNGNALQRVSLDVMTEALGQLLPVVRYDVEQGLDDTEKNRALENIGGVREAIEVSGTPYSATGLRLNFDGITPFSGPSAVLNSLIDVPLVLVDENYWATAGRDELDNRIELRPFGGVWTVFSSLAGDFADQFEADTADLGVPPWEVGTWITTNGSGTLQNVQQVTGVDAVPGQAVFDPEYHTVFWIKRPDGSFGLVKVDEVESKPFLIRSSISQVIALNSGFNEIVYDRLISDQGEIDGNGYVVIPRAGWYQITARLGLDNLYTASRAALTVKHAGVGKLLNTEVSCNGNVPCLEVSGVKFLGKNNVIAAEVYLNGGAISTLSPDDPIYIANLSTLTMLEMDPIIPPTSRKIVGVGDSIMAGAVCGADNVAVKFISSNVVNFGQNGVTTTYLAGIQSQVVTEADTNADLVIHITVNDLASTLSPDISVIVGRLETFVNAVSSLYRRTVWVTPPPGVFPGSVNEANYADDRASLIAEVISRSIPNLRIARTDQNSAIGVDGRQSVIELHPDVLHPSALGQYYISKVILPLLQ